MCGCSGGVPKQSKTSNLFQTAGNIITGFSYLAVGANEDLSVTRMAVCNNCDKLRGGVSCSVCGCVVKAKTRVEGEHCPLNKW